MGYARNKFYTNACCLSIIARRVLFAMTRLMSLVITIILLLPTIALAAQFEATVSNTKAAVNQPMRLKLILTDAVAKEEPDLSGLQAYFTVHNAQKFKNFSSVNGKSKSEEGWQIVILPKMPGELIIPVISIKTDKGMQYTQAINIFVDAVATQADLPIKVKGQIEKDEVFVQEPFIYKLTIFIESPIANANLDKIEIADCTVEDMGEPKRNQTVINGKHVQTTEVQYLITPLKAGRLEIPPITLRGEVQSTHDDNEGFLDPFDNMSMLGNFRQMRAYEPFVVQTAPLVVNIKAAVADIQPWLPLYALEAQETWQGLDKAKVGEPIVRNISLNAVGATGQQLPSLKSFHEVEGIKVYADLPDVKYEIDMQTNKLKGSRKEQFSLIPTKPGIITIPAISIVWWDLQKKQKAITVLPEKQITVIGGPADAKVASTKHNTLMSNNQNEETSSEQPGIKQLSTQIKALYFIIALLIIALLSIGFFMWHYSRKMQRLLINKEHASTNNTVFANKKNKEVKFVHDITSLQEFILDYAMKNWQLPENFVLKEMPMQLTGCGYIFDKDLAEKLFTSLDKGLYGGGEISIEDLKTLWQTFSKTVVLAKNKPSKNGKILGRLNPT